MPDYTTIYFETIESILAFAEKDHRFIGETGSENDYLTFRNFKMLPSQQRPFAIYIYENIDNHKKFLSKTFFVQSEIY